MENQIFFFFGESSWLIGYLGIINEDQLHAVMYLALAPPTVMEVVSYCKSCCPVAYCVVAVESAGRQITMAFLERVKEDFNKRYGGGKATTAKPNSLNKEFGYVYKKILF